jgi:hypothetical protein
VLVKASGVNYDTTWATITGTLVYQGSWNAATNTPTLTSSVGTNGYYYVVGTSGSTNLNGITDWVVGDWAIFNGTIWQKIDNTDLVSSVNGQTGVVVLTASSVGALAIANNLSDLANTTTARTNLGLGSIATQNANAVAITGGTINGTTIGATAPATGVFTTLTATGQTDLGTGSANYLTAVGSAGAPAIYTQGSSANIQLSLSSKGSANLSFQTNTFAQQQFVVSHTASAVNYVQVTGAATTTRPQISSQGSDANIGLTISSKGNRSIGFATNNAQNFEIASVASTVNYPSVGGSVAGSAPYYSVVGTDTNIDLNLTPKGTGSVINNVNGGTFSIARDSASNAVKLTAPNQNLYVQSSGGGAILFNTSDGTTLNQMRITSTASVVNYVNITGSATGSGVTLSAQGSDTNIDINLVPKGTGSTVYTGGVTVNGLLTAQTEVLKGTGQNFLTQSQTFTAWGVGTVTVTGSATTAPDSTSTASSILSNSTSTNNFISRTASPTLPTTTYTLSVYAKKLDSNFINLTVYDGANGSRYWFNISTGTLGSTVAVGSGFTSVSGQIVSAGSGWYRCVLTATTLSVNSIQVYLAFTDADASLTQTTGKTNYIWGSQLELGSIANTYIPTTTTAVYGTPTLSFSGVSTIGLESNGSLFVQPAGTGALQAQATTSSATGGNARGANAVDWQTARNGATQVASSLSSVLSGGTNNTSSGNYSVLAGGVQNSSGAFASVVSGGWNNIASASNASIVGGYLNTASGVFSFVGNGKSNTSAGWFNFIGNGFTNSGTSASAVTTQSATMNATTAVTLSGSNANIKVGQIISGTSIGDDTYVAAISGTSLTLSKVASGSSTSTLSFFTPHGVVVGGGNNQATGSYSFIGGGGDAGTAANRNVASGDWSTIAGGRQNTATQIYATICGGQNNSVNTSGQYGFLGGGATNTVSGFFGSVIGGFGNTASGQYSTASGSGSSTRGIQGVFASSTGNFTSAADSQWAVYNLRRQTTDATPIVLATDTNVGSTYNQVILPNNSAYYFKGSVIANVTGAANGASWSFEGAIMRGANAASTVLMGTPAINRVAATAGATAWVIALTADTTNGGLAVTVTGAASTTIRWVCKAETTEVTF